MKLSHIFAYAALIHLVCIFFPANWLSVIVLFTVAYARFLYEEL